MTFPGSIKGRANALPVSFPFTLEQTNINMR